MQTSPQPRSNDTFLIRLDQNLGKHTLDVRYNYNLAKERGFAGDIASYLPLDNMAKVQSIAVGDTVPFKPNLLNEARISFNRVFSSVVNLNPIHISDLGSQFPVLGPAIPPAITIPGRLTLGSGSAADGLVVNESWELFDSINWIKDRHTVKAGFNLLKLRYLNRSSFNTMGTFAFTGQASGNPAADFLLGKAESLQVASPLLEQAGRQTNTYYFVQDDWRITRRLTLNLGLRYELPLPWVHPQDSWGTFRQGQQSQVISTAPVGMVFTGDPGIPRGFIQRDKNNFAPRFGFALDPTGSGRTSIRGAYGIFYESTNADIIQNTSQPFRYSYTFNAPDSLVDPLAGQPPIPLTLNTTNPEFVGVQTLFFPDANLRTPSVQHFNLTVQHELVKDLALQVGYVGKLGRNLLIGYAVNPALPTPGATVANINQRRIIQPFGSLDTISSLANSNYNALQVEVNKRYSHGFSLKGAYTFSRSIDMSSAISLGSSVPNVFDLSTQVGLSDFNAKHIGSISWIWDMPQLSGAPAALRSVFGSWQINGLLTMRTGLPFNVVSGRDVALSGTPNQRPDVVGDPRLPDDRPKADKVLAWFDRNAFAFPAAGIYGNTGRNALIGPSAVNTNLGLFKNVPLPGREGLRLQFRSEFFNVLNHASFGNPNANLSSGANMGRITSASEARVIQFALKLLF